MLKVIALLAVICAVYAGVARPGQKAPKAPKAVGSYIRGCYYTNWAHYRPDRGYYQPEMYVNNLCTHMLYAFGWMNDDCTVRAYDPEDLIDWDDGPGQYERVNNLKKQDKNLITTLSIGGWTFGTALFQKATQNAQIRATFINSAINFARQYNFDGLDIDWEYPSGAVDKANFVSLFKELRAATQAEAKKSGKKELILSVAAGAGKSTIDNGYDAKGLAPYLDFLNLMTYDFHGEWEQQTGMHSGLYGVAGDPIPEFNTDYAARYWVSLGFPANKINIGVGTYGRGWTLADKNNNGIGAPGYTASKPTPYVEEAGDAAYYEICEMVADGGKYVYVKEAEEPYVVYGDQWFSFDDLTAVKAKLDYVKANGFGGAFVWAVDLDDFDGKCSNGDGTRYPLIGLIAKELAGIVIR